MVKTMAPLQVFPSSLLPRRLIQSRRSSFLIRLPEIIRTLILLFILLHIYGVATATESYFLPRSQQFLSLV